MPQHNLVVMGGSAGAMEPLITVLKDLPRSFAAAIFVVIHTSPESAGALPGIVQRRVTLEVGFPGDGESIQPGHVYVAPPDHHLLVGRETVSVQRGPRENGFRPAIDPLFRSAAQSHGARVAAVLFSGALADGTFGLLAVKKAGGLAIVQHPDEALVPSMPLSAIQSVEVDHIVPVQEIGPLLKKAAERPKATRGGPVMHPEEKSNGSDRDVSLSMQPPDQLEKLAGPPSYFTCPECGGALWELHEGKHFRFRCHTGHGFTPDALLNEQHDRVEQALWSAVRVFQERAALHRRLAAQVRERNLPTLGERCESRAQEDESQAVILRNLLERVNGS